MAPNEERKCTEVGVEVGGSLTKLLAYIDLIRPTISGQHAEPFKYLPWD